MGTMTPMMAARRVALDRQASATTRREPPFAGMRVDLSHAPPDPEQPDQVPGDLVGAITDLLRRDDGQLGPGAVVVTGLARFFDLTAARTFHEVLFGEVWHAFRVGTLPGGTATDFRIKVGTICDGAIPIELYGSEWSFKQLHIDRDALLFSHLYGPVTGFTGGEILLVDVVHYMRKRSLCFDDIFEWSDEPTAGSKPVLRADHRDTALAESGVELRVGPDEVIFVNNSPAAGILHGVSPVVVTDPDGFHREYHRCSVKDLRLC